MEEVAVRQLEDSSAERDVIGRRNVGEARSRLTGWPYFPMITH